MFSWILIKKNFFWIWRGNECHCRRSGCEVSTIRSLVELLLLRESRVKRDTHLSLYPTFVPGCLCCLCFLYFTRSNLTSRHETRPLHRRILIYSYLSYHVGGGRRRRSIFRSRVHILVVLCFYRYRVVAFLDDVSHRLAIDQSLDIYVPSQELLGHNAYQESEVKY